MDYNFGGGRGEKEGGQAAGSAAVVRKKRLYRRIDGATEWTLLSETDHVKNDVQEINAYIARVRGGFFQPPQNPYTVQLSSGRILSFEWQPKPNVHICMITNIRYKGKTNDSILRFM